MRRVLKRYREPSLEKARSQESRLGIAVLFSPGTEDYSGQQSSGAEQQNLGSVGADGRCLPVGWDAVGWLR